MLLAGGSGRAAWRAAGGILVLAVAWAGLTHMPETLELLGLIGARAWDAGVHEIRAGLAGG